MTGADDFYSASFISDSWKQLKPCRTDPFLHAYLIPSPPRAVSKYFRPTLKYVCLDSVVFRPDLKSKALKWNAGVSLRSKWWSLFSNKTKRGFRKKSVFLSETLWVKLSAKKVSRSWCDRNGDHQIVTRLLWISKAPDSPSLSRGLIRRFEEISFKDLSFCFLVD